MAQVQVDYQTKEQYIVANTLKYRSDNLIILYYCAYSRLLGIVGVNVWSSMGVDEECRVWSLD